MAARSRWPAAFMILGLVLVAAGGLLNQWSLGKLLSPDGTITSGPLRAAIWIADLICLFLGMGVIRYRHRLHVRVPSLTNMVFLLVSTVAALVTAEFALRAMGYHPWEPGSVGRGADLLVEARTPYSVAHATLGHTIQPGEIRIVLPGGCSFTARHLENRTRTTHPSNAVDGETLKDQIWVFGCSFTYGWGVDDHETFPWVLQERLPGFEVVNFGISGYGTLQAFMRFEETLSQRSAPEVAVLAYASIQEERNVLARSWKKNLAQYKELSFIMHPYAQLGQDGRLLIDWGSTAYRALPGAKRLALANAGDDALNKLEIRLRKSNRVSRAIVEAFVRLAKERGVRPLVACLTNDPASGGILEHCRRAGIPCVDVSVDLTLPEFTNLPSDPHPSPLAQRQYADRISDRLTQEPGWLDHR